MRLLVCTKDYGISDEDMRRGDIFQIHPDSWIPGIEELKVMLVVQIPDNYGGSWEEFLKSEYAPGPTPDENVIRRARAYRLNFEPKFTPEELARIYDPMQSVDIVIGRFTYEDIVRK